MHETLGYLHDSALLEIRFDITDPEYREMVLVLETQQDNAYGQWSGRAVRITARGILFLQCVAWGHCSGPETVDRWRNGISAATELELAKLEANGVVVPAERYTVTFHSGSWFEVICESVSVE